MPDPQLVAYLRKTVPQYGAEAVREKLVEEGVDEHEIDEALAVAIKPKADKKKPLLIALGAGIFSLGAVLFFFSGEAPKPQTNAPMTVGGEPEAAALSATTASLPPGAPKGPFMGHYGWMLQLPPGYATQSGFKDLGNRTEVVFLFPEKTDPTNLGNEGLYGQLGILRMEVSPLRIAQGTIGIDSLRAGITQTLNNRGDTYELADTTVGGLPGFVVKITSPFPLVQAFVVGQKVMYVMTAGVDDPVFRNALQSLTEVSPHDTPARPG
ncbi:MAG: hypothetical protein HY925_03885 [Elusimicrobia bacterium]|nr:hypothetical protein [Elusimicrobiota bacterium]